MWFSCVFMVVNDYESALMGLLYCYGGMGIKAPMCQLGVLCLVVGGSV
jgi:hypothetical protein